MRARLLLFPTITVWLVGVLGCANARDDSSSTKCQACKLLVKDFLKGKERTARENFAGGDVSWEEEKKLSYATSETRLIEIMEAICEKDHKCQTLLEEHEELVETWWFKNQKKHPDLHLWLCIKKIKVCCANGTYGKKCAECPGGADTPCSGRGTCDGDGDRDGKGTCSCESGYIGKPCNACDAGFFSNIGDDNVTECAKCSLACSVNCTGPTAGNCIACARGYEEDDSSVCVDVDECKEEYWPCSKEPGTYCHNTVGSYMCNACHSACKDNCTGALAEHCTECATGYSRDDSTQACEDVDECKDHQSRWLPTPRPDDPNEPYPGCNFTTYCHNTVGSFVCRDCDTACDGCSGEGSQACLKCAQGFDMVETSCIDIDECTKEASNCDTTVEVCSNTLGSFVCECAANHHRVDGLCTLKPDEDSKATDDSDDADNDDDDDDDEDDNDDDTPTGKDEL